MSVPFAERIVEVTGDCGEGAQPRFRYGSGLVVGGRTVLTAAHVVADAVAVMVRASDKSERSAVLDRAWVSDPDRCDLALVELTELVADLDFVPVAVVDREATSTAVVEDCSSVGFPAFQEVKRDREGRSVRESAHVRGWISPLSNLAGGFLSFEVTATPRDLPLKGDALAESPWTGMSGAAVFAGEALVGVVAEHARRRGASDVTVTPLSFLTDPALAPANATRWWHRLGVADQSRLPRLPAPTPAPSDKGRQGARRVRFNVPHVDAHFTGRRGELAVLEGALRARERVVVTQAITGLGGVGKTQLAVRYVHDYVDDFDVVAWVRAEGSPIADLAELGAELALNLRDAETTAEDRARQVVRWLGVCEERWLLVFDNVGSAGAVREWLPATGNGRALITSRNRGLSEFGRVVEVNVFDDETGAGYLLLRADRDDQPGALALSRALGGLPLALAHAGAYCGAGTSFAEYHAMLVGLPARELFEDDPEAFYVGTVATTWQVSIEGAKSQAALAGSILAMAAYLGPAAIPMALFETLLDDPANLRERKRLHDGLRALDRFSLADGTEGSIEVHRLLQKVVRDDAEARDDEVGMTAALSALARTLPKDPSLPTWWPQYETLLPHITATADTAAGARHPDQVIDLLDRACVFLLQADAGQRALTTAESAAAARQWFAADDPRRLAPQANLASSYWTAGRPGEAIELQERVLGDSERLLGAEHPDTPVARHNLALSYYSAGRTGEAIELQERVLGDSERLLGAEHPDTLVARHNLALSYSSAGHTGEAIELLERVLGDSERLLGAEHPDTLSARDNLASSYWAAGRPGEAIELQERVLGDRERVLGAEHPNTLNTRANLASSYHSTGRTAEAIELQERVVGDSERVLGAEHPNTLAARHNLALSYSSAGRPGEAIELRERVLSDCERVLGAQHPNTLTARANLASSYSSAGRTAEAIELQERVAGDRERVLGAEHPDTLRSRASLAISYSSAGRPAEAIALEERVLGDRERLLGAEHPDTLVARHNLALSYYSAGRTGEAIELQERVLGDRERVLGAEHPDTLSARSNLAFCYYSAGRTGEAIELQERVLGDRERVLGAEHPDTLTAAAALRGFRGGDKP